MCDVRTNLGLSASGFIEDGANPLIDLQTSLLHSFQSSFYKNLIIMPLVKRTCHDSRHVCQGLPLTLDARWRRHWTSGGRWITPGMSQVYIFCHTLNMGYCHTFFSQLLKLRKENATHPLSSMPTWTICHKHRRPQRVSCQECHGRQFSFDRHYATLDVG